jgi:hypothetical protein
MAQQFFQDRTSSLIARQPSHTRRGGGISTIRVRWRHRQRQGAAYRGPYLHWLSSHLGPHLVRRYRLRLLLLPSPRAYAATCRPFQVIPSACHPHTCAHRPGDFLQAAAWPSRPSNDAAHEDPLSTRVLVSPGSPPVRWDLKHRVTPVTPLNPQRQRVPLACARANSS